MKNITVNLTSEEASAICTVFDAVEDNEANEEIVNLAIRVKESLPGCKGGEFTIDVITADIIVDILTEEIRLIQEFLNKSRTVCKVKAPIRAMESVVDKLC